MPAPSASPEANLALAKVEAGLELGDLELIGEPERSLVAGYNRDDCLSTAALRDWLEAQRATLIAQGTPVERPIAQEGEAGETVSAWQEKIDALIARLTADVPADIQERTPEQQARWLLAQILWIGIAEKKKPCGGSISGSQHSQPMTC